MRSPFLVIGATAMLLASGCGSEPAKAPSGSAAKDRQLTLTYFTMPG